MTALRALLPAPRIRTLANGLRVCTIADRRAPLVATAVVYRAGTRDERAAEAGVAHFLEHMMFKGSPRYGAGEIDRITRALGGSNNAYTSHDATLYYFTFAADRWRQALEIEADRLAALALDPAEVDSERQVILEEIAMYESEPWDALEQEVAARFYGGHPYGRPVLGNRGSLAAVDAGVLRRFHQRYYRPDNAVLVVAGDLDGSVDRSVDELFGELEAGEPPAAAPAGFASRSDGRPGEAQRVERRHGEMPRLLAALPAPAAADPDHPLLLLLLAVLGSGRASRLHRALVEDGQLCVWVSTEIHETVDPGAAVLALEVVPGIEPARVEEALLAGVERLRRDGPGDDEVARAKKILFADWVFGHEKISQQAFVVGTAETLFDAEHPWRYLERLEAATTADLAAAAERYLRPQDGVIGWSLPRE